MIRKTSIGIASMFLSTLSLLSADENTCIAKTKTMPNITTLTPVISKVEDGVGLFFTGEALVWKAHQEGLQFALNNIGSTLPPSIGTLYTPDFDFQGGFRFGLGYNSSYDNWDAYLNWTFFQPSAERSLASQGSQAIIDLTSSSDSGNYLSPFTAAETNWRLHLNVIDLEVGRDFYVSSHLALRPHIGVRSAWVYQKQHTNYSTSTVINNIAFTNNYWGIGIVAGVDSTWDLGMGFSVYGNAATSNIAGFYNLEFLEINNGITIDDIKQKPHASKAITDFQLGLRWEKLFDSVFLLFQVGWEQHMYYNQFQWQGGTFTPTPNGDLGISGITIAAKFGF